MRMGFIADKLTGVPKKILEIVIDLAMGIDRRPTEEE